MAKNNKLILLGYFLSILACKTTTDTTPHPNGQEYFNNKTGSWIIYNVDSIVFSDFDPVVQKVDTFHYQVKEIITEKFTDNSGMQNNRIERSVRNADTLPWMITNVWSSKLTDANMQKVEENIRYVKLTFPVYPDKVWPGNQFNTLEPWDYTYKDVKKPVTLNGNLFNNTVTVIQKDSLDPNIVMRKFAEEIYAEGVGMIYKQTDTVEIQNAIKRGLYYRQTAIEWSK